ncbi:unnamed protein product [Choristocarpus tenellus]
MIPPPHMYRIFVVELVEPQRVELGDSIKMKQVIDEAIVKAAIDMGYEEDHFINNVKLAVMTLACVFALVAQFWPQPFPESRLMLAICCGRFVPRRSTRYLL